ncbi:MAG: hypothetical protein N2645_20305 [Clostridia bacterium]|nr:hypothetical protein [Clostridia bacterium]
MNFDEFTYQTIEALYNDGCSEIPNKKGIYIVIAPDTFCVKFTDQTTAINCFRVSNLLYPVENLKTKFEKTDKRTLYIGKAGGVRNKLRQRIRQYIRYGFKEAENHRGGRAIWQIENCKQLLLGYRSCENPEAKERELLAWFNEKYGTFPVANWV